MNADRPTSTMAAAAMPTTRGANDDLGFGAGGTFGSRCDAAVFVPTTGGAGGGPDGGFGGGARLSRSSGAAERSDGSTGSGSTGSGSTSAAGTSTASASAGTVSPSGGVTGTSGGSSIGTPAGTSRTGVSSTATGAAATASAFTDRRYGPTLATTSRSSATDGTRVPDTQMPFWLWRSTSV